MTYMEDAAAIRAAAQAGQPSTPEMTYMEDAGAVRAAAQQGAGRTTYLEPMAVPPSDPAMTHCSPADMARVQQHAQRAHAEATTWEDAASVAHAAGLNGPTRVMGPEASSPTIQLDAATASGLAGQGPTHLMPPSAASSAEAAVQSALAGGLAGTPGLTWAGQGSGTIAPGNVDGATRAAPPGPSLQKHAAPTQVGRYAIQRAIAGGGMGVVYEAQDPQLNRKVALKLMRPLGGDFARRFKVEVRAGARLDHPNIVGIYDAGEHEGRPYMIMALIEGESLQDRLEREGVLSPAEVARIGIELASALSYAHSQDVLHRDLKPENVLITRTGRPMITDFGLAKLVADQSQSMVNLTQPGTILGTPAFMSPEQAQGLTDRIDVRTDVYSLGATLYALLTNRPPVDGPDASAVIQAVPRAAVANPCAVRPDLPIPLVDVIMRCLAKNPADRYASASELKDALAAAKKAPAQPAGQAAAVPEEPSSVQGKSPSALKRKAPQRRKASSRAAALAVQPTADVSDRTGQTVLLVAAAVALFAFTFLAVLMSRSDDPAPTPAPAQQPASPQASTPAATPAPSSPAVGATRPPAQSPSPAAPAASPEPERRPPPPPPAPRTTPGAAPTTRAVRPLRPRRAAAGIRPHRPRGATAGARRIHRHPTTAAATVHRPHHHLVDARRAPASREHGRRSGRGPG
jgi:serine/threonine protein kinase